MAITLAPPRLWLLFLLILHINGLWRPLVRVPAAQACAPQFPLSLPFSSAEAQHVNTSASKKFEVHIIAPSGKDNESATDLPAIRNYVRSQGLVPILRDDVFSPASVEPIYANTDLYRATDLIEALTDNSSVIWCIRGGEGAARLIPYLETAPTLKLAPPPKLLIGFSDITVLHTYLIKRFGWSTVHGGMLSQVVHDELDEESIAWLWDIILGRKQELNYDLVCLNDFCKNEGTGQLVSSIVGGTLTLVQTSVGTVWQIETTDKMVLLEDINEAPYRIERMLDHLSQAGLFANASGVILAEFMDSGDEELNTFVLQRFADGQTHIPVYRMHGVGHGTTKNLPVPLNTKARIEYVGEEKRRLVAHVPEVVTPRTT